MSIAHFLNTCPACGAEESLDALTARMVDDDQVRRLIADLLTISLALGSMTLRYLRLHKPARQRMRLERVAVLLGELLPDMQRHAITRKGREWAVSTETWKLGMQALFDQAEKGSLILPLEGNGYLYETVMRLADKAEAAGEREREADRRHKATEGARDPGASSVAQLVSDMDGALERGASTVTRLVDTRPPPGPSRHALRMQAEIAAAKAARNGNTTDDTKGNP